MGDKIKKFIDAYIPVTTCNLRCHYCYITLQHMFDNEIPKFKYTPQYMAKALAKERLGGTCCINFCGGGETLIPNEMPDIINEILIQGHYVMVVTNGTLSQRFDEIVKKIGTEQLKRLFFKFSFHYLELKSRNLLDTFVANINKIKNAGCSFTVEITPNDELIPYIEDIKQFSIDEFGALPHITVARDSRKNDLPILTNLSHEEYIKTWNQFNSKLFEYKISVFGEKRKEFCYAGAWSYYLDLLTGDLKQCYCGEVLQNIYADIKIPIIEKPIGKNCKEAHCYNAHAWLTWGDIPSKKAPTYLEMRDRKCIDRSNWCIEPIYSFYKSKLYESNKQFLIFPNLNLKNIIAVTKFYHDNYEYKMIQIFGIRIKYKTRCSNNTFNENQKKLDKFIKLELAKNNINKSLYRVKYKNVNFIFTKNFLNLNKNFVIDYLTLHKDWNLKFKIEKLYKEKNQFFEREFSNNVCLCKYTKKYNFITKNKVILDKDILISTNFIGYNDDVELSELQFIEQPTRKYVHGDTLSSYLNKLNYNSQILILTKFFDWIQKTYKYNNKYSGILWDGNLNQFIYDGNNFTLIDKEVNYKNGIDFNYVIYITLYNFNKSLYDYFINYYALEDMSLEYKNLRERVKNSKNLLDFINNNAMKNKKLLKIYS